MLTSYEQIKKMYACSAELAAVMEDARRWINENYQQQQIVVQMSESSYEDGFDDLLETLGMGHYAREDKHEN